MDSMENKKVCMARFNEFTHDYRVYKEALSVFEAGYTVLVVTLGNTGFKSEVERKDGVNVVRCGFKFSKHPNLLFRYSVDVLIVLTNFFLFIYELFIQDADVYHANDTYTLPMIAMVAKFRRVPFVYDAPELFTEQFLFTNPLLKGFIHLFGKIEEWAARRAQAVFVTEPYTARELTQRYHLSQLPVVVMNCAPYRDDLPKGNGFYQKRYGFPAGKKIILYQGLITWGRGLYEAVEAMKSVEEAVLVIQGWGEEEKKLKTFVQQERLERRVFILPRCPFKYLYLYAANADLGLTMIQPLTLHYYYTAPNKLFDYIMAEIPIIATDLPSFRDVVGKYNLGYLVPKVEPWAIAEAINHAMSHPEELEEIRQNLCQAKKIFCWENEAQKLLSVYVSILTDRSH